MEKSNNKDNSLIKRKRLVIELKKLGINRASPQAISFLEHTLKKNLIKIIEILKEEMTIQGRKTLKKEDVKNVLNKLKKQEDYWEI